MQTEKNATKNDGFTYSEVTYCATTFTTPNGYSSRFNNSIDVFITYEGSIFSAGSEIRHTYYTPMQFTDISVNEDGTLNINVDDGVFASYFTNDLDSAIEHLSDGNRYTVTRID